MSHLTLFVLIFGPTLKYARLFTAYLKPPCGVSAESGFALRFHKVILDDQDDIPRPTHLVYLRLQ